MVWSALVLGGIPCSAWAYHGEPIDCTDEDTFTDDLQTDLNVGYVTGCIVPVFFVSIHCALQFASLSAHSCDQGISQCLITVRLGILVRPSIVGGSASSATTSNRPKSPNTQGILVNVQQITRGDSFDEEKSQVLGNSSNADVAV